MKARRLAAALFSANGLIAVVAAWNPGGPANAVVPLASGHQGRAPACALAGELSAGGIGNLRIGDRLDSLDADCRLTASVPSPAGGRLHGVIANGDTIKVLVTDGRITMIEVESPVHRTRDSLGVGTRVERLLDLAMITGEATADGFVVRPGEGNHCGLSFWLDERSAEAVAEVGGDVRRALGMRGAGGVVRRITVHGSCGANTP